MKFKPHNAVFVTDGNIPDPRLNQEASRASRADLRMYKSGNGYKLM